MASNKTKPKRDALPARFQPFLQQAQTQGALRYGAQETGLQGLFDTATQNYTRQAAAQEGASRSLLGSLATGSANLNNAYSDAGLTPEVRAQYAGTPDGQRILASLARGQADIQQQQIGAQAGRQYIQQRLGDDYRTDVGKIEDQRQAMATERGLYESSLLDQLIGDDRSRRSKINADARQQQFDANQAIDAQNAAQTNALIGQGLLPDSEGNLQPLPGGKADPKANKPKRTTGAGTASPDAQRSAGSSFQKAVGFANGLKAAAGGATDGIGQAQTILTNGDPGKKGQQVYETVPVLDSSGQPKLDGDGKPVTKQVKAVWRKGDKRNGQPIDPSLIGTAKTTTSRPPSPSFDAPIANAATEQAFYGYVTTKTVRELQKLGYSVNQIPGLKTETQYKASRPKAKPRNAARPGTAPSRDYQPG